MSYSMGYTYKAEGGKIKITKSALVVIKAAIRDGLYEMIGETDIKDQAASLMAEIDKAVLWHNRLGHMSEKGLQVLSKDGLLDGEKVEKLDFYESCVLGKQHRLSFNTGVHKSKGILDYIHADLWGPARTPTQGGNLYFLSLIDDYSRKVWIYLLKNKSDALNKFVV
ncbi:hypothetical protein UlMin_017950 [Ulmus minor]